MKESIPWIEALIAGITGGLIAGAIGLAYHLGASPDNVLNFSGGAVGSGLAVLGALWVEANRRRRAFKQLTNSLVIPATVAIRFGHESNDLLPALVLTLRQSVEAFEATRIATPVENPLHQYGLQTCVFWIRNALNKMEAAAQPSQRSQQMSDTAITEIKTEANKVVGSIEDFLRLPEIPKESLNILQYHKSKYSESATRSRPT